MADDYTPSPEEARAVWCAFSEYGGLVTREHSVTWDDRMAEFNRMIDAVRDEGERAMGISVRVRRAQVWKHRYPEPDPFTGSIYPTVVPWRARLPKDPDWIVGCFSTWHEAMEYATTGEVTRRAIPFWARRGSVNYPVTVTHRTKEDEQ